MKLFKICLLLLIVAGFSACEVQDMYTVRDTIKGTPSNADTVLPHKFVKYQTPDSIKAIREKKLGQVLRR